MKIKHLLSIFYFTLILSCNLSYKLVTPNLNEWDLANNHALMIHNFNSYELLNYVKNGEAIENITPLLNKKFKKLFRKIVKSNDYIIAGEYLFQNNITKEEFKNSIKSNFIKVTHIGKEYRGNESRDPRGIDYNTISYNYSNLTFREKGKLYSIENAVNINGQIIVDEYQISYSLFCLFDKSKIVKL